MKDNEFKISARLKIIGCAAVFLITISVLVAYMSAQADSDPAINDPYAQSDAAPSAESAGELTDVSDTADSVPESASTVKIIITLYNSVTGQKLSPNLVRLSGSDALPQIMSTDAVFTLPYGGTYQALASPDGYYPAQGRRHENVTSDIHESIAVYPLQLPETDEPSGASDTPGVFIPEPSQPPQTTQPPQATAPQVIDPTAPQVYAPAPTQALTPDEENSLLEKKNPPNESGAVPDTLPDWAESGQPYIKGNLVIAEQLRLLDVELDKRIALIRQAFGIPEDVRIDFDADNIADVWAVYAVLNGMTKDYPYKVELNGERDVALLRTVYWSMTRVTARVQYVDGRAIYVVTVAREGWEDVTGEYGLEEKTGELTYLTGVDLRASVNGLLQGSVISTLSEEEFRGIQDAISDLSGERRAVVLAAMSLRGKVNYFWGGKSYHTGWDERWGELRVVTSAGSSTTGTVRPFGLDCSGFVTWAFINAGGDQNILQYIGNGTSNQWANSRAVTWEEARPGDLLFYKAPLEPGSDHVGIYLGGGKVIHCASGYNNVVITGTSGFRYVRTPYIYGGE